MNIKNTLLLFLIMLLGKISVAQYVDPCKLQGKVFKTQNINLADFKVFIADSEAFADVIVFEEANMLFADRPGIWFFTDNKNFADFSVFFVEKKEQSDFSIFFTEADIFAGCP